jgi:hypothetical protein
MIKHIACPTPSRHGCGCPSASKRCYGAIRVVREEFNAWLAQPGPDQGDREVAARKTLERLPAEWCWSVREILERV